MERIHEVEGGGGKIVTENAAFTLRRTTKKEIEIKNGDAAMNETVQVTGDDMAGSTSCGLAHASVFFRSCTSTGYLLIAMPK